MEQSSNYKKQFTTEDIERYHAGTMSVEERHALEKAALEDPFLSDALEGYVYTTTPVEDIAKLKKRLEEKTNKRKVVPFYTQTWFKIAALVLIIAGSGWILYTTTFRNNNTIALEQKVQPQKEKISSPGLQQTDSLSTQQESKAIPETETVKVTKLLPSTKEHKSIENKTAATKSAIIKEEKNDIASKATISDTNESFNNLQTQKENHDKALAEVPVANNAAPSARTFFKSQNKPDSTRVAYDKEYAFNAANSKDTIHNLNIVLKPLADSNMAEVVVVGYGNTKKKSAEKEI